jgi:hypothetical protein
MGGTFSATAKGTCNIVNIGSNDRIEIKCGIGKEEAQKLIGIMNKILANQIDADAVMAKLDEIQKESKGNSFQQFTSGPNSPNIAGSGNVVTYSDTSQLPILSERQISSIREQLSASLLKGKVKIHFNMSDNDANLFATDLVKALKDVGWDADWEAGMGGPGIQNPVPIVIGVKDPSTPGAGALQHVLQNATGMTIPGGVDSVIPEGEIEVILISHPVRRPQ